jgi:5'-3' exonuclease
MIIVDFSNVATGCVFALHKEFLSVGNEAEFTAMFRHALISTIVSYKKKFKNKYGSDIVIAVDSKRNWRKEIFKEYKAHRKQARDDTGLNWAFLFSAMATVREELDDNFPWKFIEVQGLEGDDIIAVLSKRSYHTEPSVTDFFKSTADVEKNLIISSDGDMKQLHSPTVDQWSPLTKKFVEIKDGWTIYEKIAKGDAGDGVPNMFSANDWFTEPSDERAKAVSKKYIALVERWYKAEDKSAPEHELELVVSIKAFYLS